MASKLTKPIKAAQQAAAKEDAKTPREFAFTRGSARLLARLLAAEGWAKDAASVFRAGALLDDALAPEKVGQPPRVALQVMLPDGSGGVALPTAAEQAAIQAWEAEPFPVVMTGRTRDACRACLDALAGHVGADPSYWRLCDALELESKEPTGNHAGDLSRGAVTALRRLLQAPGWAKDHGGRAALQAGSRLLSEGLTVPPPPDPRRAVLRENGQVAIDQTEEERAQHREWSQERHAFAMTEAGRDACKAALQHALRDGQAPGRHLNELLTLFGMAPRDDE